jgi:hypothetical protein
MQMIITLKKHVYADRCMIAKIFEKKNIQLRNVKKQRGKKKPHVNGTIISDFISIKDSYKKDNAY